MKAAAVVGSLCLSPPGSRLGRVQSVDYMLRSLVHVGLLSTASLCDQRLYKGLSHRAHRLMGTPSPRGPTRRVWLDQHKSDANVRKGTPS